MVGTNPNIKYTICPICKNLPEHLRGGIEQFYGKVPIEKWKELEEIQNRALSVHPLEEIIRTYENMDGSITIDFHAKCLNCDARWDFKKSIPEGSDF